MKARKIFIAAGLLLVFLGLMFAAYHIGRSSGPVVVYNTIPTPTPECQPENSAWCLTWIRGCYPMTDRSCHPGYSWDEDAIIERANRQKNQEAAREQQFRATLLILVFVTFWIILALSVYVTTRTRRKT